MRIEVIKDRKTNRPKCDYKKKIQNHNFTNRLNKIHKVLKGEIHDEINTGYLTLYIPKITVSQHS